MSGIYESTVTKAWEHTLEDGDLLTCFTLADVPRAFKGDTDWLPLLNEAIDLGTRVRVLFSEPEPVKCADPMCGNGCCDDTNCTNVPEGERTDPFLVRADTIEWL